MLICCRVSDFSDINICLVGTQNIRFDFIYNGVPYDNRKTTFFIIIDEKNVVP